MITVWLKIKNRGRLDFVLKNLNFWLGLFSDQSKYDIVIYSEDLALPNYYNGYRILNKNHLLNDVNCKKILNKIETTKVSKYWKGACFALAAPYFYKYNKNDIILNIDADDIILTGPAINYIDQVVDHLKNTPESVTMSADLHYSYHHLPNGNFRPHHWSFGVNVSKLEEMRELVQASIMQEITAIPPWDGVNLDYMLCLSLEKNKEIPYVAFTTPHKALHSWINGAFYYTTYHEDKNKIESNLNNKIVYADLNPRTLILK
jgi:hypothetical protein